MTRPSKGWTEEERRVRAELIRDTAAERPAVRILDLAKKKVWIDGTMNHELKIATVNTLDHAISHIHPTVCWK